MIFAFDVESIGLYGEGFAVGGVLIDDSGNVINEFCYACDPGAALGSIDDREWCRDNLPKLEVTHKTPEEVRNAFWAKYLNASKHDAQIIADCIYPVETNFLAACVRDYEPVRKRQAPYPLLDLSALLLARGKDPIGVYDRMHDEYPIHHPLADAKQSARLWVQNQWQP